jgi:hypothetical protein
MEALINKIYPTKTDLCRIVSDSIKMLMIADTGEGILKAIEYLFTNLKRKETEIRD